MVQTRNLNGWTFFLVCSGALRISLLATDSAAADSLGGGPPGHGPGGTMNKVSLVIGGGSGTECSDSRLGDLDYVLCSTIPDSDLGVSDASRLLDMILLKPPVAILGIFAGLDWKSNLTYSLGS